MDESLPCPEAAEARLPIPGLRRGWERSARNPAATTLTLTTSLKAILTHGRRLVSDHGAARKAWPNSQLHVMYLVMRTVRSRPIATRR
jgi:hypothetical protein